MKFNTQFVLLAPLLGTLVSSRQARSFDARIRADSYLREGNAKTTQDGDFNDEVLVGASNAGGLFHRLLCFDLTPLLQRGVITF